MSMLPTVPPPAPAAPPASTPPMPRRPRAGQRARWLAARTRNAARHGVLIASVGALVVIATLLLFVLVPRQVDRALAAQIAAVSPERDTLPLHVALLVARRELTRIETSIAAAAMAARADATMPRSVAVTPDSAFVAPISPTRDSAATDLQRQLVRIRQAPLVESYRSLADTRLLRDDVRARALIDAIEQLHAEREAYAALSGPDARYASMTARLTQLGQRLTRLAESTYASAVAPANAIASMADVRAGAAVDIPPMAMLLASLVLGLVLGFTFVLWRELRRPTVGDEQELEALTRTRVIVHRAVAASVRAARARRRADEQLPPIIQPTDAAWPLLHLTLSRIGDVSRYVEVVADQPVLAGAVALNLCAVAAHESRATVLVDAAHSSGALVTLLPSSVLTRASATVAANAATDASDHTRWDAPRTLAIGRDTCIDIVLPRRVRSPHTGRDLGAPTAAGLMVSDLQRFAAHHDLAVFVTDHDLDEQVPRETAVVLCARLGVTTLDWLSRTMRQLEDRGRRVRAVVLWSSDLPLAA